jgi:tellurite resistance protein TerC
MSHTVLIWTLFNLGVIFLLFLDLKVFHRKAHEGSIKEALWSSAFWIGLAVAFCVGVFHFRGHESGMKFLAGYLIEESLSVDNLFVFILIFSYFRVPKAYQHRVLFWGILGALVMRAFFILAGVTLIHRFHWIMYLFGAFLIYTGWKLVAGKDKEIEPEKNVMLKLVRKFIPISDVYEKDKFFVRKQGRLFATPLFVVLTVIEATDVLFAVDSIPAVLSVSTDPFIVYTSNIFAIMGLRSLYFALSGLMGMFRFLNYGLGAILVFVGIKMMIADIYKVPIWMALGTIVGILTISILLSVFIKKEKEDEIT